MHTMYCCIDLVGDVFPLAESKSRNTHFCFVHGRRTTRQGQCKQTHMDLSIESRKRNFSSMDFSLCFSSPIISTLVHFLLVASLFCPVCSSEMSNTPGANNTFKPQEEVHKLNIIRNRLQQINKPPVKTIQVCQSLAFSFPFLFTSPVLKQNKVNNFFFVPCRVLMVIELTVWCLISNQLLIIQC